MLTSLESLDPGARRHLPKARITIERLEGALEGLDRREQELLAAATETKGNAQTLPGPAADRQKLLLDDLERARKAVTDRRMALLSALESIRLALIRLKSGLGTVDGVASELAGAARLLDSPPT